MKMKDIPRIFPIWFLPVLVFIAWYAMICASGCRGGRALGNGSAGTVIIPQTPQEINERNNEIIELPPLEPLAPIPIVPPARTHTNAVKSNPVIPEPKSAKANPVLSNPKAAGESKPFSPTVSSTATVKLPTAKQKKLQPKLIKGDGGCVQPLPTDNKATTPEIAAPHKGESEKKSLINWDKLTYYYLFLFIAMIFGWVVYDIVQTYRLRRTLESKASPKKRAAKKPAKGTRKSRKKAISKPKKNEKPK